MNATQNAMKQDLSPSAQLPETLPTHTVEINSVIHVFLTESSRRGGATPAEILEEVLTHIPLKTFFEAARTVNQRKTSS